ncbi:hypothetical protein HNQ38_000664 [Desulfovibrio intestinalis]|uniref:Uncharacterized protein n=1 Tax=Desulfovibrio intestinalis TaxID=58621 RepID=A0A7W8BZ21_9BACT|nr:hypothetical protein [Desulfovibrio intestinalis]
MAKFLCMHTAQFCASTTHICLRWASSYTQRLPPPSVRDVVRLSGEIPCRNCTFHTQELLLPKLQCYWPESSITSWRVTLFEDQEYFQQPNRCQTWNCCKSFPDCNAKRPFSSGQVPGYTSVMKRAAFSVFIKMSAGSSAEKKHTVVPARCYGLPVRRYAAPKSHV